MRKLLLMALAAMALTAGAQEVICHRGYWDIEGSGEE